MKAGFLLSLTEPSLVGEARRCSPGAFLGRRQRHARECAHRAALDRLARGDWAGAGDMWGEILREHPRDALALQWAHLFDFYRGDAVQLAERVAPLLVDWPEDDPLHPYVLALHAFGLEESARYAEAEAVGRRALAADPRVPWAIHAVAHVMEMQGRHDGRCSAWMAERRVALGRARSEQPTAAARTASPATSAGTKRCSRSKRCRSSARSRCSTTTSTRPGPRSPCSASTPRRCCGASISSTATPARAGKRSSPAGASTTRVPGTRSSTTPTRRWRSSAPASSSARATGSRVARCRRAQRRLERAVSHAIGAPLLHGLIAFGERQLRSVAELVRAGARSARLLRRQPRAARRRRPDAARRGGARPRQERRPRAARASRPIAQARRRRSSSAHWRARALRASQLDASIRRSGLAASRWQARAAPRPAPACARAMASDAAGARRPAKPRVQRQSTNAYGSAMLKLLPSSHGRRGARARRRAARAGRRSSPRPSP